ncbi:MAG: cytochrome c biogenesis protein CcdA [Melioribacteraceae bacterium]
MIESIFTSLTLSLYENFWIAILASFAWGILSILLSPCHLSSIPLIVGYINRQGTITLKRTVIMSLNFALGILITIAIIGIITASIGRLMGDIGAIGNYFVAIIFFIMGLYLLDIIKLPWEGIQLKGTKYKGFVAALFLGLIFGIGLGPCTFAYMAPILGVVFQTSQFNFISSISLLAAFGLGHCSVIVAAGILTKQVQKYLDLTNNSKAILWIRRICGVLVIFAGIYLLFT